MLIPRIITAVILGLSVILSVLYLPPIGFELLALAVVALAVWEFSGFFSGWSSQVRIIFLSLFLFLAVTMRIQLESEMSILIIGVSCWLIAPYVLWRYIENEHNYFTNLMSQGLLGLVIFMPCWFGLVVINDSLGARGLLCLLAIICAADIGAYFSGMFLGKCLLAPKISPKKTFEGLLGGVLSSLLVAIISISWCKFNIISSISFLLLAIVACLWSMIGDLFESMLKRQAGVKDSGKILPGHGGVYDRIDSLTAAAPIFALWLLLNMKFGGI